MNAGSGYAAAMERFRILDHGCKVNRYDGERVRSELRGLGLQECDAATPADLVVLNACAVTDRAVQKGKKALRRMRRENPAARLVVTGCLTSADQSGYQRIAPAVLITSARDRDRFQTRLRDFLDDATSIDRGIGREPAAPIAPLDPSSYRERTRAFLKVQDGCDARCSFCVIPETRGRSRSRSRESILADAERLLERGFRELVLCGVHLGHYGRDNDDSLIGLVDALRRLPGSFRLRLSSLEMNEADDRLAAWMAEDPRLAPHLHLPLQSGDDAVLARMRRPYTAGRFLARVEELRAICPDIALTTDLMVGFPGETEEAYRNSVAAVRKAAFSKVHVFPFSARVGTDAARLPDRVAPGTLRLRVADMLREERNLRMALDGLRIGERARVLVETSDADGASGLCERYRRVRLPPGPETSTFVDCRIVGRSGDDLLGEPCP